MGISRSAYYDAPAMEPDATAIVEVMRAIRDGFERFGWRRMQAARRSLGLVVNHEKVKRLMRELDLQPRMRRRR
jgi:putative transposase